MSDAYDKAKGDAVASIILEALHKQDAETYHGTGSADIGERALAVVAQIGAAGFTILRTKSYRAAQERQRTAEVLRRMAEEDKASQREWMERDVFPRERYLVDRCTFLYGAARAHGATVEELAGGPMPDAKPNYQPTDDAPEGS